MHPKDVDGRAQFLDLKASARVRDGMPAIRADHEIGAKIEQTVGSLYAHTCHALLVEYEIDHLMLHVKGERRETFGFGREKVQEIPLRHEGDEFAVRS